MIKPKMVARSSRPTENAARSAAECMKRRRAATINETISTSSSKTANTSIHRAPCSRTHRTISHPLVNAHVAPWTDAPVHAHLRFQAAFNRLLRP
jgi:hypothetical protein